MCLFTPYLGFTPIHSTSLSFTSLWILKSNSTLWVKSSFIIVALKDFSFPWNYSIIICLTFLTLCSLLAFLLLYCLWVCRNTFCSFLLEAVGKWKKWWWETQRRGKPRWAVICFLDSRSYTSIHPLSRFIKWSFYLVISYMYYNVIYAFLEYTV